MSQQRVYLLNRLKWRSYRYWLSSSISSNLFFEDLGVSCRHCCRSEAVQPGVGVAGDSDCGGVLLPAVTEEGVVVDESRGAIKRERPCL